MNKKQQIDFHFEYLYIFAITCIICTISLIIYRLPLIFFLISFAVIMAAVFLVWSRKLSKGNLYLNDCLILLLPNTIAYLLALYLIKSNDAIIGFILGVAVMDVFSFTKRGKNTPNAKLMGNVNTMARLSICLPVPRKPGLQQIIGVGDIFYYSMIIMYYVHSIGRLTGLIAAIIILIGQLVNIISIVLLRRIQKERYKGYPATLFPGIFIILANLLHIL